MAGLVPFNKRENSLLSTGFEGFQNMLDDFFADAWPFTRSLAGDTFKIDVQENEKEYIVEAELPGVKKEEVDVSLNEGRLNITVSKKENVDKKYKNYIHRERRLSSMTRNIFLRDSDSEGIKAKLEEGLLTITVPKVVKPDNFVKITIE
ncbi:Hsp20/alpha crystallin family protein [Desulforamulus ruminis]|uniref:Heat shock protein Hsp20 n=1 Tax=Desulforamulus ruminis (strain ATCC 23193 / DSM 2154 / NCIMB 8452 / DL) TaxID=696281 RepID=F6DV60_DESRL|nr:Hsp20/alpha crystallin family protein [Desulforamulus ruminis]AEG59126.1 heat shock protein Hsp20 [Desulforamulus ruminis DSM 2154]